MDATVNSRSAVLGVGLQRAHHQLAEQWLERLVALVPVEARSEEAAALDGGLLGTPAMPCPSCPACRPVRP